MANSKNEIATKNNNIDFTKMSEEDLTSKKIFSTLLEQYYKDTPDTEVGFDLTSDGYIKLKRNVMILVCHFCGTLAYTLYAVLMSHLNNKTGDCYPSITTLTLETGLSRSTVFKNLAMLKQYGFIAVRSGNSHSSNRYYFPLEQDESNKTDYNKLNKKKNAAKKKSSSKAPEVTEDLPVEEKQTDQIEQVETKIVPMPTKIQKPVSATEHIKAVAKAPKVQASTLDDLDDFEF